MNEKYILLAVLAVGAYIMLKGSTDADPAEGSPNTPNDGSQITRNNPWNLPDVDSTNQSGGYGTDYDESFEKASGSTGVPFALIKAHAIRESSLNATATHVDTSTTGSFGLMQVEMYQTKADHYAKYGYTDAQLNPPDNLIVDPDTNAFLGASIIKDNLNWLDKTPSIQGLRDTINAYNTGTTEAKHAAPANYVNDVLNYYGKIIGQTVTC